MTPRRSSARKKNRVVRHRQQTGPGPRPNPPAVGFRRMNVGASPVGHGKAKPRPKQGTATTTATAAPRPRQGVAGNVTVQRAISRPNAAGAISSGGPIPRPQPAPIKPPAPAQPMPVPVSGTARPRGGGMTQADGGLRGFPKPKQGATQLKKIAGPIVTRRRSSVQK